VLIEHLKPHEVFVFGSNLGGFHGAGAARYAFQGRTHPNWRDDPEFLQALHSPANSPLRIGRWAILGQGQGFIEGREGKSYAIATVQRPGWRRSISLEDICGQVRQLWSFAQAHPEWTFLITPLGEGYAGYRPEEMQEGVWQPVLKELGKIENIVFTGES
jgi:hypothetical protein